MPTLPPEEELPTRAERITGAARRVSAFIGADSRVTVRLILFLAAAALAGTTAPTPWSGVIELALLGIGLDVARVRRYTPMSEQSPRER